MQIEVLERGQVRIVVPLTPFTRVDDALELVAACSEQQTSRVLLEASLLAASFFDLRTRFAGELLQKFQNYQLQVAAVFPAQHHHGERVTEFLREAGCGRGFRAFVSREDAEAWLMSGS